MSYPIPDLNGKDLEVRLEIKNSLFIANLRHTAGRQACTAHLHAMKQQYPDANHHCWAVVAEAPGNSTFWGFSDAGEPSGTAGRPMLQVLSHADIGEVSVVVIRYFGGTKLGTGGLVKAYSDAVKAVVAACPTRIKQLLSNIKISLPYDLSGKIEHACGQFNARIVERQYSQELIYVLEVASTELAHLQQALCAWEKDGVRQLP